MLFKSKAKKAEELSEKRMHESKGNIRDIVDEYQDLEVFNSELLGTKIEFNYPRMYFYYMCNYAEDIATLIDNKRYSSLYSVYENFLRTYGMCRELVYACFEMETGEYNELLRKYYAATLKQRVDECRWLHEDYFNSSEEEAKFINVRENQIESLIHEFFQDYSSEIDGVDSEALYSIVNKITDTYGSEIDQEKLLVDAIMQNNLMDSQAKRLAFSTWISGKSATKANIQTVITRVLGKIDNLPTLILNKHEGITEIVMTTVEKALLDIVGKVRQEFNL